MSTLRKTALVMALGATVMLAPGTATPTTTIRATTTSPRRRASRARTARGAGPFSSGIERSVAAWGPSPFDC
jgi:hypothetical protein